MMKLKMFFPKNSKHGVTLVEVVFGVVVLGIIAVGIITALSIGTTTIEKKASESAAHSEAVQKMDAAISLLSNGSASKADVAALIGIAEGEITMTPETYTDAEGNTNAVKGWRLSFTHKGHTVTGYASNTEGVFDQDVE